jgi:hypothetical protein
MCAQNGEPAPRPLHHCGGASAARSLRRFKDGRFAFVGSKGGIRWYNVGLATSNRKSNTHRLRQEDKRAKSLTASHSDPSSESRTGWADPPVRAAANAESMSIPVSTPLATVICTCATPAQLPHIKLVDHSQVQPTSHLSCHQRRVSILSRRQMKSPARELQNRGGSVATQQRC